MSVAVPTADRPGGTSTNPSRLPRPQAALGSRRTNFRMSRRLRFGVAAVSTVSVATLGLVVPASAVVSTIVDTAPTTQANSSASAGWYVDGGAVASINKDSTVEPVSQDGALHVTAPSGGSSFLMHDTTEGLTLKTLGGFSAIVRHASPTQFGFAFDVTCNPAATDPSATKLRLSGTGLPTATDTTFTPLDAQGKDGPNGQSTDPSRTYVTDVYVEPDGSTATASSGDPNEWAPQTPHTYGDWEARCTGPISSYGFSWQGGTAGTDLDLVGWDYDSLFDFGSNQAPNAGDQGIARQAGANRIATAIDLSNTLWGNQTADAVVLTTAYGYADGLGGGVLAADAGGPLLLNPVSALDTNVRNEIVRILAPGSTIYLAGGTTVLSAKVQSDLNTLVTSGALKGKGITVKRLYGANRFGTATKIADEVLTLLPSAAPQTVFVATGTNFPDALSASAAAANNGGVVLLSDKDKTGKGILPTETTTWLSQHNASKTAPEVAIGGSAAQAMGYATDDPFAFVGQDRYETSAMVGDTFFDYLGYNTEGVVLASGESSGDALSGGAAAGLMGVPVILVPAQGKTLGTATAKFFADRAKHIYSGILMGGTTAVTNDVEASVYHLIASK